MRSRSARGSDISHLRPCPGCGATNGFNAPICWSCESALPPTLLEVVTATESDLAGSATRPIDARRGRPLPEARSRQATPQPSAPTADRAALNGARENGDDENGVARSPTVSKADAEARAAALAQSLDTLRSGPARARRRRRSAAAVAALIGVALIGIGYPVFHEPALIRIAPADLPGAVRLAPARPPVVEASTTPAGETGSCGPSAAATGLCPQRPANPH